MLNFSHFRNTTKAQDFCVSSRSERAGRELYVMNYSGTGSGASDTEITKKDKPIIILGCPRSGTLLASRIIGGTPGHFLITEHGLENKKRTIPEDISGVEDTEEWWSRFQFETWNEALKRPIVETPIYDKERIQKMRAFYLEKAAGKRLVIKNPSHLTRIPFLKEMFPEAQFVFCLRNPWETIQSMTISKSEGFLVRTKRIMDLPKDLLYRAAASWGESVALYESEKTSSWTMLRYEELVANPPKTIRDLFTFLKIENPEYLDRAIQIPEHRTHNFFPVKRLWKESAYQKEIMSEILKPSQKYGYNPDPLSMPGSVFVYYASQLFRRAKRKIKSLTL